MTNDEYNELAAVWGASERPDDRRELERLARRTPRLARMVQWGELTAVAVLGSGIVTSIVLRLGPASLLTGSLLLLLLGWSAWKRHKLSNMTLLIEASDRLAFVRTMVRAKEAELNRSAIGLAMVPPGIVLTLLLAFAVRGGPGEGELLAFLSEVVVTPRGLIGFVFLACVVVALAVGHRRRAAELKRLRQLRDEYEAEADRERPSLL